MQTKPIPSLLAILLFFVHTGSICDSCASVSNTDMFHTTKVRLPTHNVLAFADDIDIALLRRFHSRIFVGPPSHKERVEMISSFMGSIDHCLDDKQFASLADRIPGWSGSDIKVCVHIAGRPFGVSTRLEWGGLAIAPGLSSKAGNVPGTVYRQSCRML